MERCAAPGELDLVELPADALDDARSPARTAVGQHAEEFLATQPPDAVDHPQALAQQRRQGTDHQVPGGMAVLVVDVLEMVQVDHHRAGRRAQPMRAFEFGGQVFLDETVLEQAGERVARGGLHHLPRVAAVGTDGGDEFACVDRLGQEGLACLAGGQQLVGAIALAGHVHDWHVQPFIVQAHDLRQFGTGALRHADVHHHHFRPEMRHGRQRGGRVVDRCDFHVHICEDGLAGGEQIAVIVHQQHAQPVAAAPLDQVVQPRFQSRQVQRFGAVAIGTAAHRSERFGEFRARADQHQRHRVRVTGAKSAQRGAGERVGVHARDDCGQAGARRARGDGVERIEQLDPVAEALERLAKLLAESVIVGKHGDEQNLRCIAAGVLLGSVHGQRDRQRESLQDRFRSLVDVARQLLQSFLQGLQPVREIGIAVLLQHATQTLKASCAQAQLLQPEAARAAGEAMQQRRH